MDVMYYWLGPSDFALIILNLLVPLVKDSRNR